MKVLHHLQQTTPPTTTQAPTPTTNTNTHHQYYHFCSSALSTSPITLLFTSPLQFLTMVDSNPAASSDRRLEAVEDEDDLWLRELLSAHQEDHGWLQELVTSHRYSPSLLLTTGLLPGVPVLPPRSSAPSPRPRSTGSSQRPFVPAGVSAAGSNGVDSCSAVPLDGVSVAVVRQQWMCRSRSWGPLPEVVMPAQDSILMSLGGSGGFTPLQHCARRLCAWLSFLGPAIFKTGIASDPHHRFFNREFGYLHERVWHFMDVVWRAPANECREMEIALIAQTREIPGCRNIKPGGEGVRADREYECFVYFVLAGAGDGNLYRACDERRVRPRLL